MDGPAEIADFYGVLVQQDVLRLEVAVQDVVGVHVQHGCTDLPDPLLDCLLWDLARFFEVLVKIFAQAGLKHQISGVVVNEEVVKFDDMRMIEEALYLDLPHELLHGCIVHRTSIDGLY